MEPYKYWIYESLSQELVVLEGPDIGIIMEE